MLLKKIVPKTNKIKIFWGVLQDTFEIPYRETSYRQLPDTLKIPSTHPPDTFKTPYSSPAVFSDGLGLGLEVWFLKTRYLSRS